MVPLALGIQVRCNPPLLLLALASAPEVRRLGALMAALERPREDFYPCLLLHNNNNNSSDSNNPPTPPGSTGCESLASRLPLIPFILGILTS